MNVLQNQGWWCQRLALSLLKLYHWHRNTPTGDLYAQRRKGNLYLKQYRRGMQMTRLENDLLPSLIFFPCCCTACYENGLPSFHLFVTHQKIFSTISWASCGPCNNRHSTNICGIKWKRTKSFLILHSIFCSVHTACAKYWPPL